MATTARPRALIVDDEENIRFLVGSALELAGFEARTAATGNEALNLIEHFRPDAIVLDVLLPF